MRSTLGDKDDLMLALRCQIFEYVRETFTEMPWGAWNQLVQKKK